MTTDSPQARPRRFYAIDWNYKTTDIDSLVGTLHVFHSQARRNAWCGFKTQLLRSDGGWRQQVKRNNPDVRRLLARIEHPPK